MRTMLAVIAIAAASLVAAAAPAQALSALPGLAQAGTPGWSPSGQQIAEVQRKLSDLGFFRGNPTGNYGPKTQRAIADYQKANGLEPSDGQLTRTVFAHIMAAPPVGTGPAAAADPAGLAPAETPAPPPGDPSPGDPPPGDPPQEPPGPPADGEAPASPPDAAAADAPQVPQLVEQAPAPAPAPILPPGSPIDCGALAGAVWRFTDSTGATLDLTLEDEGAVSGPPYANHWRWRVTPEGIEISYNSGLGLTVSRAGRKIANDKLEGDARDSRGRTWTWVAERVRWRSLEHATRCPPPGTS